MNFMSCSLANHGCDDRCVPYAQPYPGGYYSPAVGPGRPHPTTVGDVSTLLNRTPPRRPPGRRPTARGALRCTGIVAAATVLAGCFTIESTFVIDDDGTADVDFVLLVDTEQLSELAGMFGEDAGMLDELSPQELLGEITEGEDPCADLTSSLTDYEVTVREIEDDSSVGVGCTVNDVPIDDLNEIGEDSELRISQDDGNTSFELRLDGVDELAGDTGDLPPIPGFDLDELFQIRFSATAPGSLSSHNATSTDGATATWVVTTDADFVVDGNATMTAQWEPGGSDSSSVLWIVLVVAGAAVAVLAIVLLLRRRNSTDTAPPTDTTPPTDTAPPSASGPPPPPPPPGSSGGPPVAPPAPFPPPPARPSEPPSP